MYSLDLNLTKRNVPFLKKEKMDSVAEILISEFQPTALESFEEIDIDSMAEFYFNCNLRFEYLSHAQLYLGLSTFNDRRIQIYNPEKGCAEDLFINANTIVIDSSLNEKNQEHRYRFTLAHECSHMYLHSSFFYQDENQLSLFSENNKAGFIECRSSIEILNCKPRNQWTDLDTIEWQANYLGAALLMPKIMVEKLSDRTEKAALVRSISNTFNVSEESAYYRLRDLGIWQDQTEQLEMRWLE